MSFQFKRMKKKLYEPYVSLSYYSYLVLLIIFLRHAKLLLIFERKQTYENIIWIGYFKQNVNYRGKCNKDKYSRKI